MIPTKREVGKGAFLSEHIVLKRERVTLLKLEKIYITWQEILILYIHASIFLEFCVLLFQGKLEMN